MIGKGKQQGKSIFLETGSRREGRVIGREIQSVHREGVMYVEQGLPDAQLLKRHGMASSSTQDPASMRRRNCKSSEDVNNA